jgi:hypothetical protein
MRSVMWPDKSRKQPPLSIIPGRSWLGARYRSKFTKGVPLE